MAVLFLWDPIYHFSSVSFLSKQFKDAPISLHILNWSAFLDYGSFVFVEFLVVLWVYFVLNGLHLVS